jgi:hypothetical protein
MMNKSLSYAYPQRFAEGGAALPGLDTYDQNQVAYVRNLTEAMGGGFSDDDIAQLMRNQFGSGETISMDLLKRVMPGDASGQTSILDAIGTVGSYDPNQMYTKPGIAIGDVAGAFQSTGSGATTNPPNTYTLGVTSGTGYVPPSQQGVGSLTNTQTSSVLSSTPTNSIFNRAYQSDTDTGG